MLVQIMCEVERHTILKVKVVIETEHTKNILYIKKRNEFENENKQSTREEKKISYELAD